MLQKTLPCLLVLTCFAAAPARAQAIPKDAMIVAATADFIGTTIGQGGGLWLLSPDRLTYTKLTGHSAAINWANCVSVDPATGWLYVGTLTYGPAGTGDIYRLIVAGTTVVSETRITNSPPDSGSISGVTLRGGDVWYVTDGGGVSQGAIGYVPKAGGSPTNVLLMNTSQTPGLGQSITTDGREIFVGVSTQTGSATNVFAIDATAATPTLRSVALTPLIAFSNSLGQLSLAADGQIFCSDFGGFGHLVDPVTGAVTTVNIGFRAPQSSAHGGVINPWTREYAAVPGYSPSLQREVHIFDIANTVWSPTLGTAGIPGFPTGVGSNHEAPFERYGKGCPTAASVEPRLDEKGLPRRGNSISVELANADATIPAFLVLGASNTTYGGRPLPLDLGIIGATGCTLQASLDVTVTMLTTASGTAQTTLVIPNVPGLVGAALHLQWAHVSIGANALGLAMTGGGTVRIR